MNQLTDSTSEFSFSQRAFKESDGMPDLRTKQLQYENNSWKRLVGFMMDENVHMKNRLSEVLKAKFNRNQLEEVEVFQNRFVKGDELIGLLRNDAAEVDRLLLRETSLDDRNVLIKIDRKLNTLRNNILIAEREFTHLKMDFNAYLSQNM